MLSVPQVPLCLAIIFGVLSGQSHARHRLLPLCSPLRHRGRRVPTQPLPALPGTAAVGLPGDPPQLRQTRRHGQALVSSAPRGRFRTAVKTQVQVSWIPLIDVERLMTALVNAVDQAARGHRDVGYVCLIDGLREAEVSAVAGAPWGGALLRRYLELLDVYTVRYDVCREAEEPRDEPSLLAESRLLADPPLAIVEMDEEEVDSCLTS
jgi:hypothetical protein